MAKRKRPVYVPKKEKVIVYSEKYGNTVDEAVNEALKSLNEQEGKEITRDDVEITVLDEPSKGFFGIGSKLAFVRVELKDEQKNEKLEAYAREEAEKEAAEAAAKKEQLEAAAAAKAERAAKRDAERGGRDRRDSGRDRKRGRDRDRKKNHENAGNGSEKASDANFDMTPEQAEAVRYASARPEDLEAAPDHIAAKFLKEMTEKMGLSVDIEVQANKEYVYVDMSGKDCGTIIGKRGQTLDAVQYLTSLVVNKGESEYIRTIVDAEKYREKREKTLVQLANRLADKCVRSRKPVRLEPMNPYERKVIHAALQGSDKVTTKSEGEEPRRRVVIELK